MTTRTETVLDCLGWVSTGTARTLLDRAAKVAIEIEGWAFHRSKERRDRDLAKANALAANGWVLITFTFDHTADPEYICRSIRTVLAQRPRW